MTVTVRAEGPAHAKGSARQYNTESSSLGDLSSGDGGSYEPKMREHDPRGVCKHGFALPKPCFPCQRRGDAKCLFCFDFGIIVQDDGTQSDCLCQLDEAK